MTNPETLMTTEEVADLFRVHTRTIHNWRKTLTFPKPLDLPGNTLRWSRDHIEAYLTEMTREVPA